MAGELTALTNTNHDSRDTKLENGHTEPLQS